MKIKAVQFGNGMSENNRQLPGIQGRKGALHVGEKLIGGGREFFVGAIDYDRQGGLLTIRLVDDAGKPYRRWDSGESVRNGRECDALQFPIDGCFLFVDNEPEQGQGQQRGR